MPKTYVTFGQEHAHRLNNKTFDKDRIAVVECTDKKDGRDKTVECFGLQFCFTYYEEEFKSEKMLPYFPRGLMKVC